MFTAIVAVAAVVAVAMTILVWCCFAVSGQEDPALRNRETGSRR